MRRKIALGQHFLDTSHFLEARWSSYSLEGDDPLVFEAVMRCWMKANEGLSAMTGETHKLPGVSVDCGWEKCPEVGPKVTHPASPQCVVTSWSFGIRTSVWGDFWFKMTTKICKITTMTGTMKTPFRDAKQRKKRQNVYKETKNDKNKVEIIASTQWAVYRCVTEAGTVFLFFFLSFVLLSEQLIYWFWWDVKVDCLLTITIY